MKAAIAAVRSQSPRAIVVAVPVSAAETCLEISRAVDEAVCLRTPRNFSAVGLWYADFSQTTDEEVLQLLEQAAPQPAVH